MPKAPPRSRPYTYLGRAKLVPSSNPVKTYRLRFRVPRVKPGSYVFVVFNRDLRSPGKRGALVAYTRDNVDRLRVISKADVAGPRRNDSGSSDSFPWALASVVVALLTLGGTVLARRRRRDSSERTDR